MTIIKSRARRIITTVSDIWSEMDYAQRRMFEIRAGLYEPRRTRTIITKTNQHSHNEPAAEGLQC